MAVPIWKDHFSNLGAYASRYFRIRVNSTTIYQGKAFRPASSGNLYVRINDICADYIAQTVAAVPNATPAQVTFPISFVVQQSSNGSSWTNVETVAFNDDWSYDTSFDPSSNGMSVPINGRADIRQHIFQTRYASGSVTVAAKYGSTSRSISISLSTSSDGTAFKNGLIHAGVGFIDFDCDNYKTYSSKTLTQATIGLATWKVVSGCHDWVLYYKNPFGGYDHLLLEGAVIPRHSIARDTLVADYDNSVKSRETWDFMNEITIGYTVNSGLLSDDEAARMPYLLDSTEVYLCNLNAPTVFIPAILATDDYTVQKVTYNGMQMNNYTFEVRIAQNQYRR